MAADATLKAFLFPSWKLSHDLHGAVGRLFATTNFNYSNKYMELRRQHALKQLRPKSRQPQTRVISLSVLAGAAPHDGARARIAEAAHWYRQPAAFCRRENRKRAKHGAHSTRLWVTRKGKQTQEKGRDSEKELNNRNEKETIKNKAKKANFPAVSTTPPHVSSDRCNDVTPIYIVPRHPAIPRMHLVGRTTGTLPR